MTIEESPAPDGSKLHSLQLNNKDVTVRSQSNISEAVGRKDSIEPYSDHSDGIM